MKNKQKLDNYHRRFHLISPWYFFVISALFFGLAVYGLRQNNFTMIKLRQAVVKADESNGNVEGALDNLRNYVYNHMNTNLTGGNSTIKPPIQLKNRYDQLVKKQATKIEAYNQQVQDRGKAVCARQYPASGYNSQRVNCISSYVSKNAKTTSNEIPPELYMFDFVSPRWSPDLAGFSLLFSGFFFAVFVCRLVVELWFKSKLRI